MAFTERFGMVTEKEKAVAVAHLVKASTGDFDFYMFAIFGISMAALGLALDSPEVVIGSMLIAPVLYPLLSVSLAMVLTDFTLLYRSFRTLIVSFGVSFLISYTLSIFLGIYFDFSLSEQIMARAQPSTLYFIVAFISGFAATYSLVHASLNEMLPGVAISVSLMPPLAVIGIGLGSHNTAVAGGATILFLLNVLGIVLASMLAFTFMDLHRTRKIAVSAIHQEERRLHEEGERLKDSDKQE